VNRPPGGKEDAVNRGLKVFPTSAALARGSAERIAAALEEAVVAHGGASMALSGGSTPRTVYEMLSGPPYRNRIDWSRLHLFWGDERCVPPGSSESNFRMAEQALLRHVPVPPHHVHRIHGELSPAEAARAYERELLAAFGMRRGTVPRLSLVLLGLGEDGHTASLFPGTSVLDEQRRLVADVFVQLLGAHRITMTFPLLNNARTLLFLVSGGSKAAVLRSVLREPRPDLPAAGVAPTDGHLLWYADRDAASHIIDPETP
jgi:6-phosphogluconolactonase